MIAADAGKYTQDRSFFKKKTCNKNRRRANPCTDIQLSEQMGVRALIASNFPQSYGGFLLKSPGAVFTETVAWRDGPNSVTA